MWGRVRDVINHAKFQLDRFRGLGAPGGRKSPWKGGDYSCVAVSPLETSNPACADLLMNSEFLITNQKQPDLVY